LAAAGMKKGEKETRVESEGGGVLAAAEQIAGHRPTMFTQSTYNDEQVFNCRRRRAREITQVTSDM
jgi:hypothetical protein